MIGIILDMLAMNEFYGLSEEIEIAKGKNKMPTTFREGIKKAKRRAKWQQR